MIILPRTYATVPKKELISMRKVHSNLNTASKKKEGFWISHSREWSRMRHSVYLHFHSRGSL